MGRATGVDTVKPPQLITELISHLPKDSIVLDCFACSGTTAHSVLIQNAKDGGTRKFILVELMDYAETLTAERVRRVIKGYKYNGERNEEIFSKKITIKNLLKCSSFIEQAKKIIDDNKEKYDSISAKIEDNCLKVIGTKSINEKMDGLDGSFDFYELGKTIFDPITGFLNDDADTEQIRRYVWYSETKSPYKKPDKEENPYLLGRYQQNNYYFYYIKDNSTCLNWDFLNSFTEKDKAELYIIYADRCVLTEEEMMKYNIRFKQIPRDIKRV